MVGRPKNPITKIFREFCVESEEGQAYMIKKILIRCLICRSHHIGENGTQPLDESIALSLFKFVFHHD